MGQLQRVEGLLPERGDAFIRRWLLVAFFFFSSRRRHTRFDCDWSSDVCSSDLLAVPGLQSAAQRSGRGRRRGGSPRAWCRRGRTWPGRSARRGRAAGPAAAPPAEIGRASCRGRGEISGGAGSLKKKKEDKCGGRRINIGKRSSRGKRKRQDLERRNSAAGSG